MMERELKMPKRGLFAGIAIFGAIGTGKTSECTYSYAEQIIGYEAQNPEKRIGGLVLVVKGTSATRSQRFSHSTGGQRIMLRSVSRSSTLATVFPTIWMPTRSRTTLAHS
jgi:hypothetical protein